MKPKGYQYILGGTIMDNLTIFDTRDMSIDEINHELSNRMRFLEDLGMERIDSCGFVSSIMNLGIASQEKWNEKRKGKK